MVQKTKNNYNSFLKFNIHFTVMRICLLVSFLFHIILFASLHNTIPFEWMSKSLKTYKVKFLRPPVDPLANDQTADNLTKMVANQKKIPQKKEETISLNTKEQKYFPYTTIIKKRLAENWNYPQDAQENLMEGQSLIIFRLSRKGQLIDETISESAGYEILDQEAIRAIKAAAPFPPFPDSITATVLKIKVRFLYKLDKRH